MREASPPSPIAHSSPAGESQRGFLRYCLILATQTGSDLSAFERCCLPRHAPRCLPPDGGVFLCR
jgi:hypothetical protein